MKTKLTTRKKFWLDHVRNQVQSNLSQSEYCRVHKINPKSFSAQKSILLKEFPLEENNPDNLFIPVKKKNLNDSVTVKLSSGIELSFDKLPDATWIANVVYEMSLKNDQH
jgi:hypothetical protein